MAGGVTRINWAGSSMAGRLLGYGGCVYGPRGLHGDSRVSLLSRLPRRPLKTHCWLTRWMQISTHFDQNRGEKDFLCFGWLILSSECHSLTFGAENLHAGILGAKVSPAYFTLFVAGGSGFLLRQDRVICNKEINEI